MEEPEPKEGFMAEISRGPFVGEVPFKKGGGGCNVADPKPRARGPGVFRDARGRDRRGLPHERRAAVGARIPAVPGSRVPRRSAAGGAQEAAQRPRWRF